MYLFEIISVEPLAPYQTMKYQSCTGHEDSVLFLDQSDPKISVHCSQLRFREEHTTARVYTGLCYDSKAHCYWACTGKNNGFLYQLTGSFQEMDRFQLPCCDTGCGTVRAIAYDREEDALILTFADRIVSVDKQSFCEKKVIFCGHGQSHQCCIRSCRDHFIVTRRCNMELLSVVREGRLLIHSCLPVGHRILGMFQACHGSGPVIHLLTVKNGAYYYMLRGVLVKGPQIGGSSSCAEIHGDDPCPEHGHHPEPKEEHSDRDCCRGEAYREHPARPSPCHCQGHHRHRPLHSREPHRHESLLYHREFLLGSYTSIVESIALEQTALSHILNAEGEKIQKVVAVSNQPRDFLEINHSVLELVTKVIHLEQVLFSKLEMACGMLRESERWLADDSRERFLHTE